MRRFLLPLALMALVAAGAFAQGYSQQLLKGLGLNDSQITQILSIQDATQATLAKDRAQLRVATAQVAAMLVDQNVAMADVEKAVRAANEWEVQIRLAQIQRELSIRKLIGDSKWRELVRAVRTRFTGTAREQRIRSLLRQLNSLNGLAY